MSSCFIAYIHTPDQSVYLKDAINGCLVYDLGGPMHAGFEFFWLLKRRKLSESLLDACKFLVDQGRENNGYERLNYDWTQDMIAGEQFYNNCYARYGVDAVQKKIFKSRTRASQANCYVRMPITNAWLADQFNTGPMDYHIINAPEYSRRQTPFSYVDPFVIKSRHDHRIINPERLWLFLADPFKEQFHIMKANPLEMNDVTRHPYNFISEWEINLNYRALHNPDEISLKRDGMGKLEAEELIFSYVRGFATPLVTGSYNLEMDATHHIFREEDETRPRFVQRRERPNSISSRSYEIQIPPMEWGISYPYQEERPASHSWRVNSVEEPERGATDTPYSYWHFDPTDILTDQVPEGAPLIRWSTDYEHQQAQPPVLAIRPEVYERIMNWYRQIVDNRGER